MPAPKGHKKWGGKQKGTVSAKTQAWNEMGEYLTQGASQRALEIMHKCNDRDFMIHFNNLLEYFKPKQSRVTQDTNVTINEPIIIDWNDRTDSNKSN